MFKTFKETLFCNVKSESFFIQKLTEKKLLLKFWKILVAVFFVVFGGVSCGFFVVFGGVSCVEREGEEWQSREREKSESVCETETGRVSFS